MEKLSVVQARNSPSAKAAQGLAASEASKGRTRRGWTHRPCVRASFTLALASVLGCAGTRGLQVQPYGADRYIASYSSLLGHAKARTAAVRDANAFCAQRGTYMTPVDEQVVAGPSISSYSLVFVCGPATAQHGTAPLGADVASPPQSPRQRAVGNPSRYGQPVYHPSECIGAVVNGVCHGSVIDTNPGRPRCYGTMLNGQCIGPMF